MKNSLITAVAVFALVAPFAPLASAQPQGQQGQYQGQNNGQNGGQNNGQHAGDQGQHQGQNGNDQTRTGDQGRGDNQAGDQHRDRHGYRQNWRDTRSDARWDETQHNGYYTGSRWNYGPPPQNFQRPVVYGYHRWSPGQRLGYYNNRYQEVDYRQEHLRRPHRGYHWVRDNDGDFLLAAVLTGAITQVVLSNGRR